MKSEYSISQLCAGFDVTRSGYYAWVQSAPSARAQADVPLLQSIDRIYHHHRQRYGAPRICRELRQQGTPCGCKRVARLMRQGGLRGQTARRFVPQTTQSDHDQPIAPNHLAARPAPSGPNQVWVSDLTYVATAEGWLYVAVILDRWSRRVVGWSAGASLHTCLVLAALTMALTHRRPPRGLLHHSDRGVQYASASHGAMLAAAGIEPSMSRTGNPYDNAVMESFMATYKRECVAPAGGYDTRAQAQDDFFAYVETYYNRERIHSALGYQSPVDFEKQLN